MDYRYIDGQDQHHPSAQRDERQSLHHQLQHVQHQQHLPPYPLPHLNQPPLLPQHPLRHEPPHAFVVDHHDQRGDRDPYARRHGGQELQSILEVAGLVPANPSSSHLQQQQLQQQQQQQQRQLLSEQKRQSTPLLQTTQPSVLVTTATPHITQPEAATSAPSSQADYSTVVPVQLQELPDNTAQQPTNVQNASQASDLTELPQLPTQLPAVDQVLELKSAESQLQGQVLGEKQQATSSTQVPTAPKLPDSLSYKFSCDEQNNVIGVWANKIIEKGTQFGSFNGSLVDEVSCVNESTWELCVRGKVFFYVDGRHKRHDNWMVLVRCARTEEEQNLEAVQYYGDIYYRAIKTIEPGTELRVFYSDEYARHVGFKTRLKELNYKPDTDNFQCSACHCHYLTAKRMSRHIKFAHDQNARTTEIRPVINWELKRKVSENDVPVETTKRAAKAPTVKNTPRKTDTEERFICVTCGKNFPTRGRLAAHETFHDFTRTEHVCDVCGMRRPNAAMLTKHMLTHQSRPHKCEECGKLYTTKNILRRHERDVHGRLRKKFSCIVCDKEFSNRAECVRHENSHKETWKGKEFQKSELLKKNQKESAQTTQGAESEEETNKGPKDMLGKRTNYYDRPRPFKCRYCSARFLKQHLVTHHESEIHEGRGSYKCPQCPKTFLTEGKCIRHLRRHENNRPYRCQLCPRGFASQSALDNHQGEHTGLKPYKCEVCGRGFRTQKLKTKHKARLHRQREKRFECTQCGKRFPDRSSFTRHERRHKGIRPYVCLTCGSAFTSKNCLDAHTRTHTGEKPFHCEQCGKRFTLNHHLTNHMLQHAKKQAEQNQEIV